MYVGSADELVALRAAVFPPVVRLDKERRAMTDPVWKEWPLSWKLFEQIRERMGRGMDCVTVHLDDPIDPPTTPNVEPTLTPGVSRQVIFRRCDLGSVRGLEVFSLQFYSDADQKAFAEHVEAFKSAYE